MSALGKRKPYGKALRPEGLGRGRLDADPRRHWEALARKAVELGERAAGGERLDRVDGATFAGACIASREGDFPLPWVTARCAAEAFLVVARGFTASGFEPPLAGLVAEAGRTLLRMLDDDKARAFRRSLAVLGDRDGGAE